MLGRCGVLSLRHSAVPPSVRATESSPPRHPFANVPVPSNSNDQFLRGLVDELVTFAQGGRMGGAKRGTPGGAQPRASTGGGAQRQDPGAHTGTQEHP